MNIIDVYTAVAFQTDTVAAQSKADIRKNLDRILEFCERIPSYGASATPTNAPPGYHGFAPVKLVAFPEFCLQGNALTFSMGASAIEIPGEETEALSAVARRHNVYISFCAIERLPEFPERTFNCNFIIAPDGKIIHKYHKFNTSIMHEHNTSPHDVYEEYYQAYGRGRSRLQTFFPVVDTPIGKIGTLICHDGRINENWRALVLNGAEIIIHGNFVEPTASSPRDHRELVARWNAVANLVYVIAPQLGSLIRKETVRFFQTGGSLIVDPEGVVLSRAPFTGEGMTSAVIRLEHLRRRRMDTGFNPLTELRTEIYHEMFREAIYPANALKEVIRDPKDFFPQRDPFRLGVVRKLVERGILTPPKDWDDSWY